MDVFYSYTYGSCLWLGLQALPLISTPTMIITLLSPDVREPTALEEYFSRYEATSSLGYMLIAWQESWNNYAYVGDYDGASHWQRSFDKQFFRKYVAHSY